MNTKEHIAKAETAINASPEEVWEGLTSPAAIKQYMMGAEVETDWKEGSAITWKGEFKGTSYEDKGTVLRANRPEHLAYSHFSPSSGKEDIPEHYHTVDIRLARTDKGTQVTLTQDNNPSEEAKGESEKNWKMMMDGLRKAVEA